MASTANPISSPLQSTIARRLLLTSPAPAAAVESSDSTFDANVVMILSVLLCALICSLGLNSIIRCALRCSNQVVADQSSGDWAAAAAKLANTGIKKKALNTFPTFRFSDQLNLPGLDAECVICLSEFAAGELVKILPKCNHGFHVKCIDKWLGSHSSCPTCRHCLIETCQKIVGFSAPAPAATVAPVTVVVAEVDAGSSSTSLPQPLSLPEAAATVAPAGAVVISMPPLEPEGLVRGYRRDS